MRKRLVRRKRRTTAAEARRINPRKWFCVLFVGLAAASTLGQTTTRVSVSSGGVEGNAASSRPVISANTRYVTFFSDASNLVVGDTNGVRDVFVYDRETTTTVRVSVSSTGVQGNGKSDRPTISRDGRFVAFFSDSSNLVAGDNNAVRDVFVHDRDTDTDGLFDEPGATATTRVSISSNGVEANAASTRPTISAEGRYVAFRSTATNLVSGVVNGFAEIFVRDRKLGTTIIASIGSTGAVGNAKSDRPAFSADGRFVAFLSDADNLVPGDTPTFDPINCPFCTGFRDVFLHDRDADGNGIFDEGFGTTVRVSVSSSGIAGNGLSSRPTVSADGRYVEFWSSASNLVPGDTNGAEDVFVHNTQTGGTVRVSVNSAGMGTVPLGPPSNRASVSNDGRYVAFVSAADNLVAGDTNLAIDVFVHDRISGATVRVSVGAAGVQANAESNRPSISASGRWVAFYGDADNLVVGDTPTFDPVNCPLCTGVRDIFVRDRDPDGNGIFDQGNGVTARVSVSSLGVAANGSCSRPVISSDGRYVAFRSAATNLIAGDTNGFNDIFVHDRVSGATVRVSVDSAGVQAVDGRSDRPSISGDGRFVAFSSDASNLVVGDTATFDPVICPLCTGARDIFVRDRDTNLNGIFDEPGFVTTTRMSVSSVGVAGDAESDRPWLAANGRYVGFRSAATNLVAGDTNLHTDVFVHDMQTAATLRMSVSAAGVQGDFGSDRVSLSADGRFVGIRSKADNLVPGDTPSFDTATCPTCTGVRDVFVRDRDPDGNTVFDEGNATMARVSIGPGGVAGNEDSGGPKFSGDGNFIAFASTATNLVAADTNNAEDIFLHARLAATTTRVSVSSGGGQGSTPVTIIPHSNSGAMSADGRFVAFASLADDLVSRDDNGLVDIFVHDRDVDGDGIFDEPGFITTARVSVSTTGTDADLASGTSKISSNGLFVVYFSDATNLVAGDTNLVTDAFLSTSCGDAVVQPGEACDDANLLNGDGCDNSCSVTGCGNGIVTAGEQCDHGFANSNVIPDACRTTCLNAFCGDGVVDSGEQCDDGNVVPGDGCDAACKVESGGYPHTAHKNRYISFVPDPANVAPHTYQVTHVGSGASFFISPPRTTPPNIVGLGYTFVVSDTNVASLLFDFAAEPVIHIGGCLIAPGETYEVRATTDGVNFSAPITIQTTAVPTNGRFWGDAVGLFSSTGDATTTPPTPPNAWTPPDGIMNGFDVTAAIRGFQKISQPDNTWTDVNDVNQDRLTNGNDILRFVNAFSAGTGREFYPFPAPAACTAGPGMDIPPLSGLAP